MATAIYLLALLQAIGVCIGVVYSILGEIAYIRAVKDGVVSKAETAHLEQIGRGLRRGMLIPLLASFGLVILSFLSGSGEQPGFQSAYWIFMTLALLVTLESWALSRKKVSFELGSALVFTGWWFLALLALGRLPNLTFTVAVAFFVVVTGILYALLRYLRMIAKR